MVKDFKKNEKISGFFLLNDSSCRLNVKGEPYLTGELADTTGKVSMKAWNYDKDEIPSGSVVYAEGSVTEFNGKLQVTVSEIRPAVDSDPVNMAELLPVAPINVESYKNLLIKMAGTIDDPDYKAVVEKMLKKHLDEICKIPAAKTMHHSFLHGLLMHTGNMVRLADVLAKMYSDFINRDLLIAGTILHDFAKRKEFVFSGAGLVTEYSFKGNLLGHLVMGAMDIAETAKELGIPEEKAVLLQHLILAHHGEPDYGAAVRPRCAEAQMLFYIDLMDSQMEVIKEATENTESGKFSPKIPSFGNMMFYKV